jgi:hypothetical protein
MKYYFEHIKDGQICEGYTAINIANHEAEIVNDDPDSILIARKNNGVPTERPKWEERFRPPSQPTWGFFWLTDSTDLESLSNSDIGEGRFEIGIFLDRDTLADVVYNHLPRISRGYLSLERIDRPILLFRLNCGRWGFLGELQLSKRGNATILSLDYVPFPTADELFPVKMVGESDLFRYGKRKHRGEVIRRLFDSLRRDPVWQDKEKETFNLILTEIKQIRDGQTRIVNIIQSLRHWARIVQQEGLPPNKDLRIAVEDLSRSIEDLGGTSQYLEANLPLIPGILNYKLELGSEHKVHLGELLKELIGELKRSDGD